MSENCFFKMEHQSIRFNIVNHLSIDGISQSVHHTAEQLLTNRDIHDGTSPLHDVALLDQLVVTEHDNTNVVRLQVQRHALQRGKRRK